MFMKIWERYFLKKFIRMFFLFLGCFYGLYVLIDYASHTHTFIHHHIHVEWKEVVRYYLYVFSNRAEILLPLSLLIAFVHTISSLNTHHELMAFMASGFPLKRLMRPFILLGLLCVFLMYANEEFLLPEALQKLRRIEDTAKQKKSRRTAKLAVQHLILEDGSLLIFQNYDSVKERFFDLYWIQSVDNIYRIKFLSPFLSTPHGFFVDHLVRQSNGEIFQVETYPELAFPEMKFQTDLLQSTLIDPDILSLTELFQDVLDIPPHPNEKESRILTAFYWRLVLPWLCLLAIIAPAPYCVKFSRNLPIFFIYVGSLFGLIVLYMFMDAAQVVAKRQVISPFFAICVPFLIIFSYFGWRFNRINSH